MENDEVIENGFVIVRENRIHLLGNMTDYLASSFKADQVMDLKGKTIMPGIVDVHAHLGLSDLELVLKTLAILGQFSFWSDHYPRSFFQ